MRDQTPNAESEALDKIRKEADELIVIAWMRGVETRRNQLRQLKARLKELEDALRQIAEAERESCTELRRMAKTALLLDQIQG